MRLSRTRVHLTLTLVGALALGPMAVTPAIAASPPPTATSFQDDTEPTDPESTDPDPTEAAPLLLGELAVGQTLTATEGEWPEGTTDRTFQWLAAGIPIDNETTTTLTLTEGHAGKVVEVAVTAQLPDETEPTTRTSVSGLRVATTAIPSVSGKTQVGSTMTASTGAWTDGTTFGYQWLADGQPITGATGSTFVLTNAQSGKAISVTVTGAKPKFQTLQRTSQPASLKVMRWAKPTISGTLAYGSTLTARRGTWTTGTTFTYQWYASGTKLSGATGSTLKLGTAHKGKTIKVQITGKKAGHTTVSKTSATTARIITAPKPKISGSPIYGKTLTATAGTWTTGTTLSYRWYADDVAISGATGKTLKLGSGQKNKAIRVKVTGKKSGYATVTKTSAATKRVQTAPTPTISGSPKVTYTLTARTGTWSSGTSFTYQWYANGVAITGATSSKLKLSTSRLGKTIKVKVTGKKSGYPTVSRTSKSTAKVTYPLRTDPVSTWNCPSWAPIKGNADSGIYHMPSGAYYDRTKPEDCFRTESAAVDAGYRKSKR